MFLFRCFVLVQLYKPSYYLGFYSRSCSVLGGTVKGKAPPIQEAEAPRICRQSTHESGKVVSPTHQPPLSAGHIAGTIICWKMNRPQRHSAVGSIKAMKNPVTPTGIGPAAFPFVAQCVSQLPFRVRRQKCIK